MSMSYVHGADSRALIGLTIGQYFDQACFKFADQDALVVCHQGVRLKYSALRARVDALACGLLRLGLRRGDRIGIWSPNNLEWTLTQFATAKVGLILVNINPAYRRSELAYALNKVGCRALILAPSFKSSDYIAMLSDVQAPSLEVVVRLGKDKSPGIHNFDDLLSVPTSHELEHLESVGRGLQFDDPINIQFTSGTTGNPKGATLSHHNILNNGFFVGEALGLTEKDRVCIPVPLYHCFGMVLGNLGCLTHGAAMVYPAEAFDPLATLQAIEAEKCTALYGVPTMFIAQLSHPQFSTFSFGSLRTGIMAGSPCPVEVMKRVVADMNMSKVTIAYGMTETSPISFQSSVEDPIERRISTVGRIQPHCEVKIVDADGDIVPLGTSGELCTRGYSVMLGYWGDDEKTSIAIDKEGWMHTGDLAVLDDDGYCNIVGRIKDMIIRGGENIYPREIEEFLFGHPKILDVQVVGVPDQKYGEEVCAWIVLKDGQSLSHDEVNAFCQGQIARYKIPRYVQFVESFPTTVTGKIQKYVIREQMIKSLSLIVADTA